MEKKIDNNKQTPKPRKNQPQKWNEKKNGRKPLPNGADAVKENSVTALGNSVKLGKTR